MKLEQAGWFERFAEAETEEQLSQLSQSFAVGGFARFFSFLEQLKKELIAVDDDRVEDAYGWIRKGRRLVPRPGRLSPSWERVWDEQERLIGFKAEALRAVPRSERDGEWQIVMDNPYTNDGVVCYPALSFIEAAYLYAYFRKDLKKTEYIRLQKIVNLLQSTGD